MLNFMLYAFNCTHVGQCYRASELEAKWPILEESNVLCECVYVSVCIYVSEMLLNIQIDIENTVFIISQQVLSAYIFHVCVY